MANFKLNAVFTGISKSIGELTFYSSNGKTVSRTKSAKPYRHTEKRKEQIQAFTATANDWRLLPAQIKSAWDVFAEKKKTRGYNLFIKSNVRHNRASETISLTPPSDIPSVSSFSLKLSDTGKIQAEFTLPAEAQTLHLTLVYRETDPQFKVSRAFRIKELGINSQSPAVIEELIPQKSYEIFAVLSSDEFGKSQKFSESVFDKVTV
jgi:hypothetical protein